MPESRPADVAATIAFALAAPTPNLWRWPVALGLLTASGLVSALVSDGWGDVWSWLALGVPIAVGAWFMVPHGRRANPRTPTP